MKIFILIVSALALACQTRSVLDQYSIEQLSQKTITSEKLIQERHLRLQNLTLEDKAEYFEKRLLSSMHDVYKFTPKLFHQDNPGDLRMDMTALFLASMAYKYAVTGDVKDKNIILEILESIYQADASNGLDGFIPYKVTVRENRLETTSNETHINVYTQLLFAYLPLLNFSRNGEIQEKVLRHLHLLLSHLEKTNFTLVDNNKNEVKYSDLSPSGLTLQTNRKQLLLVLVELYLKYSNDQSSYLRMDRLRKKLSLLGYERSIQQMHFEFLKLEFPTHSSSWLNLMNSYMGYLVNKKDYFKSAYYNLYKNYEDEKNLLFILMWNFMNLKSEINLIGVEQQLIDFPVNPDNSEVINSMRKELRLNNSPNFVKLKRESEALTPLPIYERPLRSFEWKQNQMRVDGNYGSPGKYEYTGIDYLIAYWMYQWLKTYSKSAAER